MPGSCVLILAIYRAIHWHRALTHYSFLDNNLFQVQQLLRSIRSTMTGVKCAIKSCRRCASCASDIGVSFHSAPLNPVRRKQWNGAVGFTLPINGRVCSDHFLVSDYLPFLYAKRPRVRRRLKSSAVPSVGLDKSGDTLQGSHEAAPSIPSCEVLCREAPHRGAMVHYIRTAEVVTKTEGDTFRTAPCDLVLRDPHEEHTYAYRWHAPRYASASTQADLIASTEKRDFGIQTQLKGRSKSTQCLRVQCRSVALQTETLALETETRTTKN
ncbi:uncharacterized protein LOC119372194 [Rhipicephalus sanguineus]|uniref:uncharacterized protein LOC119372194 n=1 Tax=Rhipicephalus sanguineus TaxID=34632 RepID=UPI001894AB3D|nr:uncharacterized protein LOC119372194 [Rhipicephalus sanguineus]